MTIERDRLTDEEARVLDAFMALGRTSQPLHECDRQRLAAVRTEMGARFTFDEWRAHFLANGWTPDRADVLAHMLTNPHRSIEHEL